MFKTTKALVLREVRYKESDRILTVFTDSDGKLTVRARGALRKGSRTAAATQQLTCSELTLFGSRGRWMVNEAALIEPFPGLREDIGLFALGSYFAECLEALSVEEEPDGAMLQLGLNALFALSRGLYPPERVKAAFEMRLMCLAGYGPNLSACRACGCEEPAEPLLGLEDGSLCCRACRRAGDGTWAALCPGSLAALRYIISAPAKRLFSFRAEGAAGERLADAAERYLLAHAERKFSTLDYWKKVR
ncbi:MAG: DNA repair protein RecO [Clostridia bacterium]|nr:MAG: DNA repair protein RecO [Clostridia bacterium]